MQDRDEMNLSVAQGVAVREFKLEHGHGFADYLLFVNGKAVGVLEAKQVGTTLSGGERMHDDSRKVRQLSLGEDDIEGRNLS